MEVDDQEGPESNLDRHEPQHFEGDVFGSHDNYLDDDFGQLHDPESGSIDNDDEQEELDDLESGWEPERPGAQAASLQTDEDPTSQQDDHDEPITNTTRSQAEAHIADSHIVVQYSDRYPDRQAGAPLKKLNRVMKIITLPWTTHQTYGRLSRLRWTGRLQSGQNYGAQGQLPFQTSSLLKE